MKKSTHHWWCCWRWRWKFCWFFQWMNFHDNLHYNDTDLGYKRGIRYTAFKTDWQAYHSTIRIQLNISLLFSESCRFHYNEIGLVSTHGWDFVSYLIACEIFELVGNWISGLLWTIYGEVQMRCESALLESIFISISALIFLEWDRNR